MTADLSLAWVEPGQLRPNTWNPNVMDADMYAKATASIHQFGFVDPITVRRDRLEEVGKPPFEIIDGENRWRASLDLRLSTVPIIDLGVIEDQVAQKLTIVLNETRGNPEPAKLGELLRRLSIKESRESLLATLPFSPQAFEGLTGLPTLQWDQRPRLNEPRSVQGWVERTYRMPAEAAQVVDQAIARVRVDDPEMAEWQALEAIAADFLA